MLTKKVFTVIPKCSILDTNHCIQDCTICEKARLDYIVPVMIPYDQASFKSVSIDKNKITSNEQVTITILMDNNASCNDMEYILSNGLQIHSNVNVEPNQIKAVISCSKDIEDGFKTIAIKYRGIMRIFRIEVVVGRPEPISLTLSDNSVKLGDNIRVEVIYSRGLTKYDDMLEVKYDTQAFELIQDLTISKSSSDTVFMILQAKVESGLYPIRVYKMDNTYIEQFITINPQEMIFATEEDIDYLFPELQN